MAEASPVVDDAIFMRNMIRTSSRSGGFEVVGEAANGIEAIEKYKELKPGPHHDGHRDAVQERHRGHAGDPQARPQRGGHHVLGARAGVAGDGGDRGRRRGLHRQAVPRRGRAGGGEEGAGRDAQGCSPGRHARHVSLPRALRHRGLRASRGAGARSGIARGHPDGRDGGLALPPRALGEGHVRVDGARAHRPARPPGGGPGRRGPAASRRAGPRAGGSPPLRDRHDARPRARHRRGERARAAARAPRQAVRGGDRAHRPAAPAHQGGAAWIRSPPARQRRSARAASRSASTSCPRPRARAPAPSWSTRSSPASAR